MFRERREEVNEVRRRVNGQRDAVTLAGQNKESMGDSGQGFTARQKRVVVFFSSYVQL